MRLYSGTSAGRNLSSQDWAGYVVASDFTNPNPTVTAVSGSWMVPEVAVSPRDTFSAAWVGIGGLFDGTLIQAGTEQDSINGLANYRAWYELIPLYSRDITQLTISPGDVMVVTISLLNSTSNQWLVDIRDVTNGETFSRSFFYRSSRLSAEWIVERPTIDGTIATLAYFNTVSFTFDSATIGGRSGAIGDFPFARVTMYDRQNLQLVTVSPLTQKSTFLVQFTLVTHGVFGTQWIVHVTSERSMRSPHVEALSYLRALAFSKT